MFHRVKAENEKPQETPAKPQAPAQQQVKETQEKSAPEETLSQEAEKETETMTTEETQAPEAEAAKPLDIPHPSTTTSYATSTAPRNPGFSGYSGYGSSQSTNSDGEEIERRLVIGRGITMSGEIESCDHLIVEGTIEAALKGANVLHVAESGTFYGSVDIQEATIAGRFEGELIVKGRLTVRSGGSITGTVSYKEIAIEAGAVIDGKLSPLKPAEEKVEAPKKPQAADNTKSAKEAAALAKARELKAKSEKDAANSDGELFASEASAAE